MKKYTTYKSSGVEWIGEIPEHWQTYRLKYVADANPSNIDKKTVIGEQEVLLCNYVDVYKNEFITEDLTLMAATASAEQNERFQLKAGDILVTKDSEDPTDIAIPAAVKRDMPGVVCGYHLTHIRSNPQKLNGFYLFRLFQSYSFNQQFTVKANGVTRFGLPAAAFTEAIVCCPPLQEQQAIASYLDQKTAQLDSAIRQKERLIELLQEERTAIINQAVTKGLDPNAKMKDSGVEWLGLIPEHWEVKKLKYSADVKPSSVDKKSVEGETKVLLCNYVDVYKNEFISSVLPFMEATASTEQILKFELKKGDVLATKDSEDPTDIAVPAAVMEDLTGVVCGYHLTHIRTYPEKLNGFYLHRLFQTYTFNKQFTVKANGVTRFGLSVAAFTEAFVCLPPLKEQDAIVAYIDKKTALINETVSKKKNEILLLHEYRTALINEVVTGKICVF